MSGARRTRREGQNLQTYFVGLSIVAILLSLGMRRPKSGHLEGNLPMGPLQHSKDDSLVDCEPDGEAIKLQRRLLSANIISRRVSVKKIYQPDHPAALQELTERENALHP